MIRNFFQTGCVKEYIPEVPILSSGIARKACIVGRSLNFTHNSSGNWLTPTFDVDVYDPHSMHSTSSNADKIYIPTGDDGVWMYGCSLQWSSDNSGLRIIQALLYDSVGVVKSGSTDHQLYPVAGGNGQVGWTIREGVVGGDYVSMRCWQNGAASLATQNSTIYMNLWCFRVA